MKTAITLRGLTVRFSLLAIFGFGFFLAPVHGAICGIVKDSAGNALGGVKVYLVSDTATNVISAGDGTFQLGAGSCATGVQQAAVDARAFEMSFASGKVRIYAPKSARISLGLYSIKGQRLFLKKDLPAREGYLEVELPVPAAPGIYFVKARASGFSGMLKILSFDRNFLACTPRPEQAPPSPAKILAAPAAVGASKAGYFTTQILAPDINCGGQQITLYGALTGTVTLKGHRMNSMHSGDKTVWRVFLIAWDGTGGIRAEVNQIWNDYYLPYTSLDGDQARELERQFTTRLMYYIDGPLMSGMLHTNDYGGGDMMSFTGTVHDSLGLKWITAASTGSYGGPTYPAKTYNAITPLGPVLGDPRDIDLGGAVTMHLIHVPAGKFLMGGPLEQYPHNQEGPGHLVTFSKGFYMMETPITYAQYAAVTGDNTTNTHSYPADAACNISCVMFKRFVDSLTARNPSLQGKARAATRAELEYTARCGTSNLNSNARFVAGTTSDWHTTVKTTPANGWGFYQTISLIGNMSTASSERSSDKAYYSFNVFMPDEIDPKHPPTTHNVSDATDNHVHSDICAGPWTYMQNCNNNGNRGTEEGGAQRNAFPHIRQRVVVDE